MENFKYDFYNKYIFPFKVGSDDLATGEIPILRNK